ncbi:MAG: tetratricopeptide repeat protein [Burkholderiales bacterium]|nr:tetratricopeptide repeat protein [Burkholderiales bacterium]
MKVRKTPTASAAASAAATVPSAELSKALAEAIGLLREERIDEAEPALESILARWPGQPDALHYLGVLRHTQGRIDEAISLIHEALAAMPDFPGAWNNLGNVLLLAGRGEEAAEAYERAVQVGTGGAVAQEEAVRALSNLGVLHRKLHQIDRSELALREAVRRDPDFADAWYNLAITLLDTGRIPEGLMAHSKAVALWPEEAQSRQEIIRALTRLGERERAARLLREWLTEDPGNPVAEHMLAACLADSNAEASAGDAVPARASDDYVQQVFDGFAASFDAKLEALNYRAPGLVVEALRATVGAPQRRLDIVDAGCGTGLCGPGLKPFAHRLAGCDLSEGMLRRAKTRALYDVLHQAELMHYLRTQPLAFDAVVSADTLCYFGALDEALAAAHIALRPGGALVFTVEALPESNEKSRVPAHRLQANGRYAHGASYLRTALAAAGFEARPLQAETLRMEGGEPVPGWLVTALKAAAGGTAT